MFLTAPKKKARDFNQTIAMLDERGASSTGGIYVDGVNSIRQSTVWACVKLLSEIVGHFPIKVQNKQDNVWFDTYQHQALELLAEPNDWMNQQDLISFLQTWSELGGNGYAFKVKNGRGEVKRILPLQGSDVESETYPDWSIKYTVGSEQVQGEFKSDRIFHLRNFGTDGFVGESTISNHRKGVGLAIQLEEHASEAYKGGLHSNKWVELDSAITDPKKQKEFEAAMNKYKGAKNSGEIPVLAKGRFHEFSRMSAVDAQYIESRKMQKQEIASIFGVPLFLLNDTEKSTTWGTGLEEISRSFVRFSLNPRLSRLSKTLLRELIPEKERLKTRFVFDTDTFTLGEFKERMEGYKAAIESGVFNPNDCLELEDRAPRENGDKYRIPLNIGIEGEQNTNDSGETE